MTITRRPFSWQAIHQLPEESPERLAVEPLGLFAGKALPVTHAHGTKVSDALAPRVMPHHGIVIFPRHRQPTAGAMLAEMDSVQRHVPAAIVKSCISGDFDLTFARVSIFLETSSKNSS
jgi:hypothetical protein